MYLYHCTIEAKFLNFCAVLESPGDEIAVSVSLVSMYFVLAFKQLASLDEKTECENVFIFFDIFCDIWQLFTPKQKTPDTLSKYE